MNEEDAIDSALGYAAEAKIATAPSESGERNRRSVEAPADRAGAGGSIVMFPTNGVGFGHFTRQYAIARRLKQRLPGMEIVFFTTMPTLHIPYDSDFKTYHLAGLRKQGDDLSVREWNSLLYRMLSMILDQYSPFCFIFDGAFPYAGMLRAIRDRESVRRVWFRRGGCRHPESVPETNIQVFDEIVRPMDSIEFPRPETEATTQVLTCPPVVLLDQDELLPRETARRRLGLPMDGRVVYVQLGAGRINDIASEVRHTIDALLEFPEVTVVLGESMLGRRLDVDLDRVRAIRDYPNSMYFNAFDATVQAGGYNSFHESRSFGLPALFYPNMQTSMDDQLSRCRVAEEEGWGIVIGDRNPANIRDGVSRLLSLDRRPVHASPNGADLVARMLAERFVQSSATAHRQRN